MNTFKEYFELCINENIKFTVIVGSGYHKEALGDHSILSNWKVLLSKISNSSNFSENLTLEFEKVVNNRTKLQSEKASNKIEELEIKHIANHLTKEQEWVLSQEDRFYYPNIFNPKYISDVISLNFDYIAEEKTKKYLNYNDKVIFENQSSFSKELRKQIFNYTRFRKLKNNEKKEIRFWYPHGSILDYKNIVLGIHKYANLVSNVIKIRNKYKEIEKQYLKDLTWYSQIIENPVLILGASMSEAEWDLWSAIVYSKRNFAKNDNNEKPIFKMMSPEEASKLNNEWILPLYKDMDFTNQWKVLEKLLNQ
jgi:hypothetical protein